MAVENSQDSAARRLDTWKEIAGYFGRDERTVRRWEASRGLPVYRVPGSSGGTVYAFEPELRAWLQGSLPAAGDSPEPIADQEPQPAYSGAPPSRGLRYGGAIILFVVLGLGLATTLYWVTMMRPGQQDPADRGHDPRAVALYRAGLYEWQTRTPAGLSYAVTDFQRAIARDPGYARAYAGLANCYNLLREYTAMPASQAYPLAMAAASRAIALDPRLAEAHAALAFDEFYWARKQAAAREEFGKALSLAPNNPQVHHWYATFLMTMGEPHQALQEIDRAASLDSASSAILADKGLILFTAGEPEAALGLLRRLEQMQPGFFSPHLYLATLYFARGDDADYVRELQTAAAFRRDSNQERVAAAAMTGFAKGGHTGMLTSVLAVQKQLYTLGQQSAYGIARTYAELHDEPATLAYLRMSLAKHELDNIALLTDPELRGLRSRSDFPDLLRQAGLRP